MQVMEAPVRVLKGLAAGAGKIIGVADRRKARAAAAKAATAEPAAAEAVAAQAAPAGPQTSGNVKVVTPEPAAAEAEAAPEAVAAPEAEAAPEAVVTEPAAAEAAAPTAGEPAPARPEKAAAKKAPAKKDAKPAVDSGTAGDATSELPLANYDELTVNSLRARMTKLSPGQLTVLIEYEKAHQGREDVIGMFERRITRINSGQTTSFQAVK
jgi:hypothetical protein